MKLLLIFITANVAASQWASTNSFILALAPESEQPSGYSSTIKGTCVETCAQTGFTASQSSTTWTFTPGLLSKSSCTCPTSTGTQFTSGSAGIISNIITPSTPGYPSTSGTTVNLIVSSGGYAQVQSGGISIMNYYIGGCQTTSSSSSPCQGSATFTYQSNTLPSSFGDSCERACATSSYTFIIGAGLTTGIFTPNVGAISSSCTCIPIIASISSSISGSSAIITVSGNVPGRQGVTYRTSPISSAQSSLTFTLAVSGSGDVGAITYSVSNCIGAVAAYCLPANVITSGATTAVPTNGQTIGQATTGGTAIYNPNAAALNPAAPAESSNTGAIVGGIVGGIVGIALIGAAVLFYLGKLPCGVKTAASIASSSPAAKVAPTASTV